MRRFLCHWNIYWRQSSDHVFVDASLPAVTIALAFLSAALTSSQGKNQRSPKK